MGGSLGSKKLNNIIRQNIEALLHDYQIIHLTEKDLLMTQSIKRVCSI